MINRLIFKCSVCLVWHHYDQLLLLRAWSTPCQEALPLLLPPHLHHVRRHSRFTDGILRRLETSLTWTPTRCVKLTSFELQLLFLICIASLLLLSSSENAIFHTWQFSRCKSDLLVGEPERVWSDGVGRSAQDKERTRPYPDFQTFLQRRNLRILQHEHRRYQYSGMHQVKWNLWIIGHFSNIACTRLMHCSV